EDSRAVDRVDMADDDRRAWLTRLRATREPAGFTEAVRHLQPAIGVQTDGDYRSRDADCRNENADRIGHLHLDGNMLPSRRVLRVKLSLRRAFECGMNGTRGDGRLGRSRNGALELKAGLEAGIAAGGGAGQEGACRPRNRRE